MTTPSNEQKPDSQGDNPEEVKKDSNLGWIESWR